jgi:hypothetical protein
MSGRFIRWSRSRGRLGAESGRSDSEDMLAVGRSLGQEAGALSGDCPSAPWLVGTCKAPRRKGMSYPSVGGWPPPFGRNVIPCSSVDAAVRERKMDPPNGGPCSRTAQSEM